MSTHPQAWPQKSLGAGELGTWRRDIDILPIWDVIIMTAATGHSQTVAAGRGGPIVITYFYEDSNRERASICCACVRARGNHPGPDRLAPQNSRRCYGLIRSWQKTCDWMDSSDDETHRCRTRARVLIVAFYRVTTLRWVSNGFP